MIGRAGIKIPFLEKKDELNLQLIPIDVKTSSPVPTADYININVDAAVNVKISDDVNKLNLAAQNFLNKKPEYIASVARQVLEGNIREIVGNMKLEQMVSDRQAFAKLVTENAAPDLGNMGLEIISFNVQNFVDDNSVIENLGVDNIVKIQKNAAISRAESEKEIAVAKAIAQKEANEAQINADTVIAERNNELEIRKAELKIQSDVKKAEADAAYRIQEQEQRKAIEISNANANIAKEEREIELKKKQAEAEEQALDAQIKKKAEAEKYAAQQKADADLYERQKNAEAEKFEEINKAEALKAKAEAERFAKEQEAAGIAAVGKAEAAAIEAKGLAEAQAMEKKADAYSKYNKAAVVEMLVGILPEVASKVAEPLTKIGNISIIGGGDGNGVNQVADSVPLVMAKMFKTVEEATGVDLRDVIKAETYDAKVNKNINVTGIIPAYGPVGVDPEGVDPEDIIEILEP